MEDEDDEDRRVRKMTVGRFLKRVLHQNLLRTPCLVIWDECFFVSCNMLARMSKVQIYDDVQIICCGDPRQLHAPHNHWRGTPVDDSLEHSQMLTSFLPIE